jgi:hypothetical protein
MPRRPASVTQADISRAIRAARESGAGEVTIDSSGVIHIALTTVPPRGETSAERPGPAPLPDDVSHFKRLATPRPDQKRLKGTESG